MSDSSTPTASTPKPKIVNTNIVDGVVTVTHADHTEPLVSFDANQLIGQPVARDLVAYGVAQLLRQAANGNDPHEAISKRIDQITRGDWTPGRHGVVAEIEPVVEALATHLNKSVDFVAEKYLPRYCQQMNLVTKNGRMMLSAAKAQLSKHPELAPLVTRIIGARAKANRHQPAQDLSAIAAE
jgi:hypothetical protein